MPITIRSRSPRGLATSVCTMLATSVCTMLAASALSLLSAAPALAAGPRLQSVSLTAGDVPGFSPVDPEVETFKDPNDQGQSQAFIECARGHALLDQFDTGADALTSQVYGEGENAFGTPSLSTGTAVFGDGSVADARAAETTLASPAFEDCWATTTDSLNQQQGITVPIYPSTVVALPNPGLGSASVAFAINSRYQVLGSAVNFQLAITVVQKGAITVMLITLAYGESFPDSTRLYAATRIAQRMGSASPAPAPVAATECLSARLPQPTSPVLSDAQVSADLGQTVHFGSAPDSTTVVRCSWEGRALPADKDNPYRHYTVQLWLGLQFFSSAAAAKQAFQFDEAPFGPPTAVPGLGATVNLQPGEDDVTRALTAMTPSNVVFGLNLNSPSPQAVQDSQLVALAHLVLQRLGTSPPGPPGPPAKSVTWPTDWAGKSFCRTQADGYQYLGTTWRGLAACGTPYYNENSNSQGTIGYKGHVFDTVGFQCVELAERYFYYLTGHVGPFANGSDLAWAISHRFPQYPVYPQGATGGTGRYRSTLVVGDILSMWNNNGKDGEIGHVGVVTAVEINPAGTGTITILDENASYKGIDTVSVTNGVMTFALGVDGPYTYFQWLYGLP